MLKRQGLGWVSYRLGFWSRLVCVQGFVSGLGMGFRPSSGKVRLDSGSS